MNKVTYYISILIIFLISIATSCNKKIVQSSDEKLEQANSRSKLPKFLQLYPEFKKDILVSEIKEYTQFDSTLYHFYNANNFQPVWIEDTINIIKLRSILSILDNVDQHGLNKEMFGKEKIESIILSLDSGKIDSEYLYSQLTILECSVTSSIIKYITGMNYGFTSLETLLNKDLNNIQIKTPDSIFTKQLYADIVKNPATAMFKSLPTDSVYLKMQEDYKYWKSKMGTEPEKIKEKANKKVYKIGEKNKNISAIANRLIWTGEYEPSPTNTDTLHHILSNDLMAGINSFRRQNSFPEDEELGNPTIEALNRPSEYYLSKLAANMERYRWKKVNDTPQKKHVEVNVAAFILTATQPNNMPLNMRICVGSKRHKTPLLQSTFGYINLNPKWNVPSSIAKNEVFPLQRKDTSYLRRHNMRLYKGGEEIDYTTIDWKKAKISEHAYYVRQDPGNSNSLGRLKFVFNNKYSVYLHDTPVKKAFKRINRAVSHGCIRLQQPIDFAFFCISPSATDEYKDRLLISIDQRPRTRNGINMLSKGTLKKLDDIINLKDKISLTVDYKTVYMLPGDNTLYYADDVYGYDDLILNTLKINHSREKLTEKDSSDGIF